MVSNINPNLPVNGTPALKADLRANLLAAKTEIETLQAVAASGSFTQAGTGAVTRTVTSKLQEASISVTDFGADPTGVADSTSAIQLAINYCATLKRKSHAVILFEGSFKFDPAGLNWSAIISTAPSAGVTLLVDGALNCTTTLVLKTGMHLVGLGGGGTSVQFTRWPCCNVGCSTAGIPAILMQANGSCSMYQVQVIGNGDAPVVLIQHPGNPVDPLGGPYGTFPFANPSDFSVQNALFILERISILHTGNTANAHGLMIRHGYWIWMRDFAINVGGATGGYCVYLLDDGGGSNSAAGILYFQDGVTSQRNIYWKTTSGSSPGQGSLTIKNVLVESSRAPFITFENAGQQVDHLTIERCDFADQVIESPWIDTQLCQGPIRSIRITDCGMGQLIRGKMPQHLWYDPGSMSQNTGTQNVFINDYPRGGFVHLDGEFEGRDAFRNVEMMPGVCPVTNLGAKQDATLWTSPTTGFVVTSNQLAPDGSLTAYKLSASVAGVLTARPFDGGVTGLVNGDWIIAGVWVKSAIADLRMNSEEKFAAVQSLTGGVTLDGSTSQQFLSNNREFWANAGWFPVVRFWKLAGITGGTPNILFSFNVSSTANAYYAWKPFLLRVDGTVWTARDVARLAARLTCVDQFAKSGVLSQFSHQTFRTGIGPASTVGGTARPSASAMGPGAQWFDTSINGGVGGPIWVNTAGTGWINAAGTTV